MEAGLPEDEIDALLNGNLSAQETGCIDNEERYACLFAQCLGEGSFARSRRPLKIEDVSYAVLTSGGEMGELLSYILRQDKVLKPDIWFD